jgi:glycosyltransferase involved in cell wall biosynthesis
MIVIVTTHPIQYQVPLWRALARDGRVPFEVWYLTLHAVKASYDVEFGKAFAWDIDMLGGYPHRVLKVAAGATPTTFLQCRIVEPLVPMLQRAKARAVWVQGWQVLAYWQAVWLAKRAGCEAWLRAESNDLAPVTWWKRPAKQIALRQLFSRVDRFLCIGRANSRLYRNYNVPEGRLVPAPYAIDNTRFAAQAASLRPHRNEIRRKWGITEDAFCVMFCGKFIDKKRPHDLIAAALALQPRVPGIHLLFVGSGELGAELRAACNVAFDADGAPVDARAGLESNRPFASFTGFLNQTEISQAYIAADCLVLPSDHGETWGLVVNEAMASGLPCIISDRCGCAEDLGEIGANTVFRFGDIGAIADSLAKLASQQCRSEDSPSDLVRFSFERTVQSVIEVYGRLPAQ